MPSWTAELDPVSKLKRKRSGGEGPGRQEFPIDNPHSSRANSEPVMTSDATTLGQACCFPSPAVLQGIRGRCPLAPQRRGS